MSAPSSADVRPRIIAESRVDYKYRKITENLAVDYEQHTFAGLCRSLIGFRGRRRPSVLHLRYLKWRGYVATLARYALLLTLARVTGVRVVWSAHNVREYSIPTRWYNLLLRRLVTRAADVVIVFDRALLDFLDLPGGKVQVASFGEYRSFYREPGESDERFRAVSTSWLADRGLEGFDLVSVGAYAPSKRVEALLEIAAANPDLAVLVVAPEMPEQDPPANVLLWTSWVQEALVEVFQTGRPVGFLGHSNLSVPTTFYVFASFGIPVLALDAVPVTSMVQEHDVGAVVTDPETPAARSAFDSIRARYGSHVEACAAFMADHSWERSARVHERVFTRPGSGEGAAPGAGTGLRPHRGHRR